MDGLKANCPPAGPPAAVNRRPSLSRGFCLGTAAVFCIVAAGAAGGKLALSPDAEPLTITIGLGLMALPLLLLPGVAASETRHVVLTAFTVIACLLLLVPEAARDGHNVKWFAALGGYGATMAVCLKTADPGAVSPHPARPVVLWSLLLALVLGLMAAVLLFDPDISGRIRLLGRGMAVLALIPAYGAFLHERFPKLLTASSAAGLFAAWLAVPGAGMEAFMVSEALAAPTPFAVVYWKWVYVLCVCAAVASVRLFILARRQRSAQGRRVQSPASHPACPPMAAERE